MMTTQSSPIVTEMKVIPVAGAGQHAAQHWWRA